MEDKQVSKVGFEVTNDDMTSQYLLTSSQCRYVSSTVERENQLDRVFIFSTDHV